MLRWNETIKRNRRFYRTRAAYARNDGKRRETGWGKKHGKSLTQMTSEAVRYEWTQQKHTQQKESKNK